MMSRFRPILLALSMVPALAAPALAQEAQPVAPSGMTARLLVSMDRLGDAAISPDGRWIAYVVRTMAPDLSKSATHILLADQDHPKQPHVALQGGPGRQDMPTWSADGHTLYFRGPDAKGVAQIWRAGSDGAAPVQLTHAPLDVGAFQVAADGGFAVASFRVFPDCPTLECTVTRAAQPSVGTLYTSLNVRFFDSYGDGRYNALFRLDLGDGKAATPLMPGFASDVPSRPAGSASAFALSPDGKTLVFSARPSGVSANLSTMHRLFEVSLAAPAAPREIGAGDPGSKLNPVFSPDGRQLAYMDKDGVGSDGDRAAVRVRDLASGTVREIGASIDRWPNAIAWAADGRTIYARSDDDGRERLYAYRLSGKVERLPVDGVSAIDVSRRGLMLVTSSFSSPPQVYAADAAGRSLHRVSDVGAGQIAGLAMARTHSLTFSGWNGEPVQAFVTEPLNPQPGRRYPVLFVIHGGPHGVYQDEWSFGRNPQVWAARGYATVMVNFHGSTGFGKGFAQAVLEHRGDRVLEDLQKGWAAVLAAYPSLDGDRACAMGSSFGGYMVDWIAGVWNEPWRCFITHAGTFDTRAYSSDLQWHGDRQTGGAPWEVPEAVERFNPVRYAAQWKKPILVTHGGRDFRVPFDQGLSAFTLAQRRCIPSELLYLPGENHIVSGAAASVLWYDTVDAWLDRWTAK
ncbi:MAG: hypothetical protein ABT11_07390 [Novosphingobium sp. SCN 66-18]|nr:MAG: hypothetical protein ABT11_07390 [Novosphingobium sp. SCN 66-18]